MDMDITLEDWQQQLVATLVRDGKKIPAIKMVRVFTLCSLKDGKEYVEALKNDERVPSIPSALAATYMQTYNDLERLKLDILGAVWFNSIKEETP